MAFQFLNRNPRLPTTPTEIAARLDPNGDNWWMTDAERLALTALLSDLRPECAIEVGVYRAGSLAVLARYSKKVYALDIDPECEAQFASEFPNVQFVTGDAKDTLPRVLEQISAANEPLGFVLIDADHSRDGVRRDIESVLRYTPTRPLYLLLHDSFNPECRRGIREANWSASPHVHLVELDFVPGRFVTEEEPDGAREMWCGFALAVLLPEQRRTALLVHENESLAFSTALAHSVYRHGCWWNPHCAVRKINQGLKAVIRARLPRLFDILRNLRRGATHDPIKPESGDR